MLKKRRRVIGDSVSRIVLETKNTHLLGLKMIEICVYEGSTFARAPWVGIVGIEIHTCGFTKKYFDREQVEAYFTGK